MIVSGAVGSEPRPVVDEGDVELRGVGEGVADRERDGHVIEDAIDLGRGGGRGAHGGGDVVGDQRTGSPFDGAGERVYEGDARRLVDEICGALDAVARDEKEKAVGANTEDDGVGQAPVLVARGEEFNLEEEDGGKRIRGKMRRKSRGVRESGGSNRHCQARKKR